MLLDSYHLLAKGEFSKSLGANFIFLSPHYDDIAFSLGSFVAAHPGGTIANLFTRSAYTAGFKADGIPHLETVERISAIRSAEDDAFCAMAGLRRFDLALDEPILRGRKSRDLSGVAEDVEQLEQPLIALLQQLFAENPGPRIVFCPAGIGTHANHHATRAVVIENIDWIEQHARVMFYEDLHYSSRYAVRFAGIRDLRRAMGMRRGKRQVWRVSDPSAKLAMINAYSSQHANPVSLLTPNFTPSVLWPFGIHEAFWSFPPMAIGK